MVSGDAFKCGWHSYRFGIRFDASMSETYGEMYNWNERMKNHSMPFVRSFIQFKTWCLYVRCQLQTVRDQFLSYTLVCFCSPYRHTQLFRNGSVIVVGVIAVNDISNFANLHQNNFIICHFVCTVCSVCVCVQAFSLFFLLFFALSRVNHVHIWPLNRGK